MFALLSPVAGNHAYVVAPVAPSDVDAPAQIVFVPDAFTEGIGLTVTVTVLVPLQAPVAPVTV